MKDNDRLVGNTKTKPDRTEQYKVAKTALESISSTIVMAPQTEGFCGVRVPEQSLSRKTLRVVALVQRHPLLCRASKERTKTQKHTSDLTEEQICSVQRCNCVHEIVPRNACSSCPRPADVDVYRPSELDDGQ